MLLVVFGAGASYDSIPSRRRERDSVFSDQGAPRPPLANALFDERGLFTECLQRFPACHPIVPYLRSTPGAAMVNVEQVLGRLQSEADAFPDRHRQLAAVRFYLRQALKGISSEWLHTSKGITTYKTLLDQIRMCRKGDESVCFVTFNYDTIFEEALESIGVRLNAIEDYTANSVFSLIKIHGSVDWWRPIRNPPVVPNNLDVWEVANTIIASADTLQVSDQYVRNPVDGIGGWPQEPPMFPAIAIPLEQKRDFECPHAHLQALERALVYTRKILFVGWRATDVPFLDLLKERLTPGQVECYVVAGGNNDTRDVVNRLTAAGINIAQFFLEGGFSDFVLSRKVEPFLRAPSGATQIAAI